MADVLLDATSEAVKCALSQSYLIDEITIETDYANFRVTLTLKNWASLNLKKDGKTNLNKGENFTAEKLDEGRNHSALSEVNVPCTLSPLAHFPQLRPVIVKLERCDGFQINDAVKIEDSDEASNFDHDTESITNFEMGYPEIKGTGPSEDALTDPSLRITSSLAVGPQKLTRDRNIAEFKSETSAVMRKRGKLTKKYYCKRCDFKCVQADSFHRHNFWHKKVRRKPFHCSVCKFRFKTMEAKESHWKKRHLNKEPYRCDQCEYKTHGARNLQRHLLTHSGERVPCTLCDKTFSRQDDRDRHVNVTHMGHKPHQCEKCEYRASSLSLINSHMNHKHSDVKDFTCQLCDYAGKTKHALKLHVKRMHSELVQRYQCNECSFQTLSEERYRHHQTLHKDNSPLNMCPVCNKSFIDSAEFRNHVKKHTATKVKKFSCPECEMKFATSPPLQSHMFCHTGKKEFRCRICPLEFALFSSMVKHFKKQHPSDHVFLCTTCNFESNSLKENKRHLATLKHLQHVKD